MRMSKGFTIIELLIVVAIIGVIAAIAIPSLLRARDLHDQRILFGRTFNSLGLPPTPQQRVILQPLVTERLRLACGNRLEIGQVRPEPPTTDPVQIQYRLDILTVIPTADNRFPACSDIKPLAKKNGFTVW